MFNKCCVVDCDSRRETVKLFQFPKTEIGLRFRMWLKCVSSGEQKSFDELRKFYVCEKHFEKRFVTPNSRLRYNAYPTLFTADEIASGIPDVLDTDPENPNIDHNYCKTEHNDHNYCKVGSAFTEDSRPCCSLTLRSLGDSLQKTVAPTVSDISITKMIPSTSTLQDHPLTNISTPSKYQKNLVRRTALLTPNCKKLYKEYNKAKRKLEFCKKTKRCAISFLKEKSFEKMTEGLTPIARKLLWMQIKQAEKKTKGRRFNDEEKLICLSIMKQSPKCYKFLQKIFILPSKTTLNKFVSGLKIEAGINSHIFQAISEEIHTWDENQKYCTILFDEVALEPGLTYDKQNDVIEGLVELDSKTNDFADHALVFMLRGAIYKWEQPIAFYFCKGQTSAVQLKTIIKTIVSAVKDTGLIPIALISDQGAAFQSALRKLQEETKREQILAGEQTDDIIIIEDCHLSVIYDPPHLIKGLRNNFLNNDIQFEGRIAKWSDIIEVYKTDCKHARSRLLHKLNDEYVIPEKIKKMKVKNCARVFSKTMAATLAYSSEFSYYSDGTPVSRTLMTTSKVISFFDDLFDSVNGASFSAKGKPLRSVVTEKSIHHEFWQEAIKKIENMKFVNKEGKEKSVPTQKNWVVTLKSYQRLWYFFDKKNVKIMRPRYFNSDPLENFFGQVRAYNYRNTHPDCHTFKNTFRSLLITRFIRFHSNTFNCEEDSAKQLLKLKTLICTDSRENNSAESSHSWSFMPESFNVTASQERLSVHSQAYVTGWVVRKILGNIKCSTCESNLISNGEYSVHKWISVREYQSIKNNMRKLTYPSEQAIRLAKYITKEAIEYLENQPKQQNILNNIKTMIKSKYSLDFLHCEMHKYVQENFLDYTLRLTIFNWCNSINKILKGTDILRLPKQLPSMQNKALLKYKSKLKYKNK